MRCIPTAPFHAQHNMTTFQPHRRERTSIGLTNTRTPGPQLHVPIERQRPQTHTYDQNEKASSRTDRTPAPVGHKAQNVMISGLRTSTEDGINPR